jgi:AraC-like DNA-binding protein
MAQPKKNCRYCEKTALSSYEWHLFIRPITKGPVKPPKLPIETITARQPATRPVRKVDGIAHTGGTAPLDMMLHLISRDHGRELSAAISEMFVYERIRNEQDHQRVPLKHMLGTNQPKLQEIVALMEANLEEPIDLDELAVYVAVSRRQLERLFQKYLHCSPSRYYLKLRLIRARQLLKQTPVSIIEVASICGFVSTPHFSKCYREYFGIPPRDERVGSNTTQQVVMIPLPQALVLSPLSGPLSALSQARNESTFASVRL